MYHHTLLVDSLPLQTQQVAYVSYSTPTRHVESSYLLRKPKPTPSKVRGATPTIPPSSTLPLTQTPSGGVGAQESAKKTPRPSKPRPPQQAPPTSKAPLPRKAPPTSTVWSSVLSFALLVVMFAVTFLAYDHYTAADSSFVTQALSHLRHWGVLKNKQ